MIYAIKKGSNKQISANVNSSEIECNCRNITCTWTLFSHDLLECFENLRISCGNKPITITSGHRCVDHNHRVGGVPTSRHIVSMAIDLVPPGSMPLKEFAYRAKEAGFDKVITYPENNFIHCSLKGE